MVDFSDTIVHIAAVLPRQTAVEILRRVNRFTQGFIASAIIAGIYVSLRGKCGSDIVTSLGTATEMFPQPLSYTTSATTGMVVLSTVGVASLVSAKETTKLHVSYD